MKILPHYVYRTSELWGQNYTQFWGKNQHKHWQKMGAECTICIHFFKNFPGGGPRTPTCRWGYPPSAPSPCGASRRIGYAPGSGPWKMYLKSRTTIIPVRIPYRMFTLFFNFQLPFVWPFANKMLFVCSRKSHTCINGLFQSVVHWTANLATQVISPVGEELSDLMCALFHVQMGCQCVTVGILASDMAL